MNGKNGKEEFSNPISLNKYYDALGRLCPKENSDYRNTNLYHYTSTRVLNAILSNGCFRASNLFYLNDKIEYRMGIEVLKKIFENDPIIEEYIEEISNLNGRDWYGIYSISFSNKEDELQQWITYAKESGVCIELNSKIIWEKESEQLYLGVKGGDNSYLYYHNNCFLKLAYEKGDLLSDDKLPQLDADIIKNAFAKAILQTECENEQDIIFDEEYVQREWKDNSVHAKNFLKLLSAYYKEERFKGEGEIRAAFLPAKKSKKTKSKIEYYEQMNGILRPYMDVVFLHNYQDHKPYKVECPIKSITIGPGGSQEGVFDSVVHRLEYGEIKVWKYKINELSELLSEFVYGCFEQFSTIIEDDCYKYVANLIIANWCQKAGYGYKLKETTKIAVEVELFVKENEIKTEEVCIQDRAGMQNGKFEKMNGVVKRFLNDNFFSVSGIWVKKSSLSYIF